MKRIWQVLNENWFEIIVNKWREIPSVYKKSFLIVFVGVNIAFAFDTISFIIGDHDWTRLIKSIGIHSVGSGRFSILYVNYLLTGNNILPILTNIYAFFIFSLSSVLLCIYWKVPKTLFAFSAIGLLLVIQPYSLLSLWYSAETIGDFSAILFVIISFMLSERAFCENKFPIKMLYIFISVILTILAFGTYQPIVNTIVVVLLARIIIDLFLDCDGSFKSFKALFLKHKYVFLSLILGGIAYLGILKSFVPEGRLDRLQIITLKDFIPRVVKVIDTAFTTFWQYNVAFFPSHLIKLFAVVFLCGAVIIVLNILFDDRSNNSIKIPLKQKIVKSTLFVFLTAMLIICAKSAAFMSNSGLPLIQPHIIFFGDAFLHIFPIALIFIQRFRPPKNLMIIICMVLINMCLIQDALALKAWRFGFEAEKMLWNRIMARIEENPAFLKNKKYEIITIGQFPSYRPYYYERSDKVEKINNILHRGYAAIKHQEAFGFFFPEFMPTHRYRIANRILTYLSRGYGNKNYKLALEFIEYMKEEINVAQGWPSPNSIFIKDDVIMIVFDSQLLDTIKKLTNDNGNNKETIRDYKKLRRLLR